MTLTPALVKKQWTCPQVHVNTPLLWWALLRPCVVEPSQVVGVARGVGWGLPSCPFLIFDCLVKNSYKEKPHFMNLEPKGVDHKPPRQTWGHDVCISRLNQKYEHSYRVNFIDTSNAPMKKPLPKVVLEKHLSGHLGKLWLWPPVVLRGDHWPSVYLYCWRFQHGTEIRKPPSSIFFYFVYFLGKGHCGPKNHILFIDHPLNRERLSL